MCPIGCVRENCTLRKRLDYTQGPNMNNIFVYESVARRLSGDFSSGHLTMAKSNTYAHGVHREF